jgi:hypothetical protein
MKSAHTLSRRAALTGTAAFVAASPITAVTAVELDPAFALASSPWRHEILSALDAIAELSAPARAQLLGLARDLPDDVEAAHEQIGRLL